MVVRKGTKLVDNPKDKYFKFRITEEELKKLTKLAEIQKKSKSEVIRSLIEKEKI